MSLNRAFPWVPVILAPMWSWASSMQILYLLSNDICLVLFIFQAAERKLSRRDRNHCKCFIKDTRPGYNDRL